MTEIIFEEPPPDRKGSAGQGVSTGACFEIARRLKERPGEWARVGSHLNKGTAAGRASAIRAGKLTPYRPKGSFQATVRSVGAENRIYARYVGDRSPMSERVRLLPQGPDDPVNKLTFSDGRVVICIHDGAPCNGCKTPREDWPAIWEPGFLQLIPDDDDE